MNKVIELGIIEDDTKYQSALKTLFEFEEGFRCTFAYSSVEKCLERIKCASTHLDILLLDINLPGKTGTESIPDLKAVFPDTKIIMLTQFDNDDHIFNAMSNGANGYLLKSSSLIEIIQSVKDAMNGISPMNGFIASRVLEMFKKLTVPKKNYQLTPQEKKVLQELVEGLSKKTIADKLFISFHTVDSHIRNIYKKLNVHNQIHLVSKTIREQII